MELEINVDRVDDVCVLTLSGEVDVYTAPSLRDRLLETIESGCVNVIVHMDEVGFIDSSGIGVLVGALRRAKERSGTVRVVCNRDNVLKTFRILGLDKVFPLFTSLSEARTF